MTEPRSIKSKCEVTTDIVTSVCARLRMQPHNMCARRIPFVKGANTRLLLPTLLSHQHAGTRPPPSAPYLAQASPTERVQLPVARCQLAHAVGEVDAVRLLDQR